jgi:uncharacterized membrane protein YdjX (TVP38/TMEM64 family)
VSGLARLGALIRRFGPVGLVVLVAAAILASGAGDHLSLHELRERRAALMALVGRHPVFCLAAYMALYALAVGLSLPVSLVLTLGGGLLFGPWIGGAAAAVGCTAGSTMIFLICRTAVGEELRGASGSLIGRLQQGLRGDAFAYVMALRLMPIAPLWLVNLALGFVEIPIATYVAASFVGLLPVSIIYAGLGSGLNQVFATGARLAPSSLVQPRLLAPLLALALLALAPVIWKRFHRAGQTG